MGRVCWTLAVCLAISTNCISAVAGERLFPHAEQLSGPWGYIDKTGKVVIPLQFGAAAPFSEKLAAVRVGKKYGFIEKTGRLVIESRFDAVQLFQNGRAAVKVGRDWGFIDATGSEIVKPQYASVRSFSAGFARVRVKGTRMGTVDLHGQTVIAPEFWMIDTFSEGLAAAQRERDGKYGYIDTAGKVVIPFQFERAFAFQNGRALVLRDASGRSGFIDKSSAFAILFDHKMVSEFSEGLAVYTARDGGFGVIDADGKILIPPRFTNLGSVQLGEDFRKATAFSEGLLPVSEGKAYGYIDRHGTYVIQPQFWSASSFRDGVAVVRVVDPAAKKHFAGLIDRTGKFIAPPIYDSAWRMPGGLVQVSFDKRLGYLDAIGRPLTFTTKEVEEYVAAKREKLKPPPPPPPGRAVIAKVGDTEYYLRLPEGLCALTPQDRKYLEELRSKRAAELESAKLPGKLIGDGDNTGLIVTCDALERIRSNSEVVTTKTFAFAGGMRKDRPDPSANAGLVYMAGLMCMLADKSAAGAPRPKDRSAARVETAFKRLEAGESTQLPGLLFDGLACYSATVGPAAGDGRASPQTAGKAAVGFHTLLTLPDWLIMILTRDGIAASPDAFFQRLEQEKALARAFLDANLKK